MDPHELAQLRRFAELPLSEKVRWLEEAHRMAIALGAVKAPAGGVDAPAAKTERSEGNGGGGARSE